MKEIIELVRKDPMRLKALAHVHRLDLPQCYIAAGFVRNLVWDNLHNIEGTTPLNDIDVVYFDEAEQDLNAQSHYEQILAGWMPDFNWQVRNQAMMHQRNGDRPYLCTRDAMSFWPEKETAVAIRQTAEETFECIAAFGFESLFEGEVTFNPKREIETFTARIEEKNWLRLWPKLQVRIE
jgi:hypothetical protein